MYAVLGYLSSALLALLFLPYVLRILNQKLFGNQPAIHTAVKTSKKLHRPLGVLVAVISIVHGYLALGGFRLHTGSLLYFSMLLTALCGVLFFVKKKKNLLFLHRFFAVVTILLWAVHLLFPSAIYYLLN